MIHCRSNEKKTDNSPDRFTTSGILKRTIQSNGNVSQEMKELINFKKAIYSVNIEEKNGKLTEKGRGFLIRTRDPDKPFSLLILKSATTDFQSSDQEIAAYRYRSEQSRSHLIPKKGKKKEDYVIKIKALPNEQNHSSIILFSFTDSDLSSNCKCSYLNIDCETEGNPNLVAYTFCSGIRKLVELHFTFNGKKYGQPSKVDPPEAYNKIASKPECFTGAPVMVEGNLGLVVGMVKILENEIQPHLFDQSDNLPPGLRPCKY